MPTRRVIKGVLDNFLGTFVSRYSDLRGFWLHGQVLQGTSDYDVDLLGGSPSGDTPLATAQRLAVRRFQGQLLLSRLDADLVRSAHLEVRVHAENAEGRHGGSVSSGCIVEFAASAVMDDGRSYRRTNRVFVAPHDARRERRRAPETWGA